MLQATKRTTVFRVFCAGWLKEQGNWRGIIWLAIAPLIGPSVRHGLEAVLCIRSSVLNNVVDLNGNAVRHRQTKKSARNLTLRRNS